MNSVKISADFELAKGEEDQYKKFVEGKEGSLKCIDIIYLSLDPKTNEVSVSYNVLHQKFERIRRITGYLTGTTDRWNVAKQAEEHDRVSHI